MTARYDSCKIQDLRYLLPGYWQVEVCVGCGCLPAYWHGIARMRLCCAGVSRPVRTNTDFGVSCARRDLADVNVKAVPSDCWSGEARIMMKWSCARIGQRH